MQLSQKAKVFSQLFSAFLKSTLNFEHIQKVTLSDLQNLKTVC